MEETIYKFRKALGLSTGQLGRILGVSSTTIRNWELGKSKPQLLHVFRVQNLIDETESKSLDYSDRQKKFFEDYCQCPPPEEARGTLGFSREEFVKILGCTEIEYFGWIMEGKNMPLHYKKFIKFLLKKKEERKL